MIKPGTYRTTKDLPALSPDARKRYDWRARPVKAGTLFVVEQDAEYKAMFLARPINSLSTRSVSLKRMPELFACLEPVEETPSIWLRREGWEVGHLVGQILDQLVSNKTVTLVELQELAARILAKEE